MAALSTPRGTLAALAIDQRKSLRRMIAEAAGSAIEAVSDAQLTEFKSVVSEVLTPEASAVLLDPEYGLPAAAARAPQCGLLLTYEADGYENPRPYRMLELLSNFSVRRLRDAGADGIKILLSYTPFEDEAANQRKKVLIERIGHECHALDMPFFLEPVGYDPEGRPNGTLESARRRPEIVLQSMREFSKDAYRVDVLKVEFPVDAAFVQGTCVCRVEPAYSKAAALDYFREADRVSGRPYVYLSAGVTIQQFNASLQLAAEAGAQFSGVLCGRVIWQDGVRAYAQGGASDLRRWLSSAGQGNIASVHTALAGATPLSSRDRAGVASVT